VCPDGRLTPMLTDIIDDPAIALSFTGLRTQEPDAVADAVARTLRRPRRIVSVPRWRGAQVRALGALPDLVLPVAPLFTRLGRAQQDRLRRSR
ncbi:MAG: SDR family NAD(P)-dependent oxidoreductase, partial [bacterium]